MKHGLAACAWTGAVFLLLATCPVSAADPVALVEDVTGASAGVQFMDYLTVGKTIHLSAGDTLIVDYLHSCMRETITSGVVTVGQEQSTVKGGSVKREKVECDGGKMHLSAEQAAKSGVIVFRAPPKPSGQAAAAHVEKTLYGLSPLVDLRGAGQLVVERIDRPGERMEIEIPAGQLVRGAFYDFAKHGKSLSAGGVYRASAHGRSVVFKIDPFAQPGNASLVGRLLQF